MKSRRSEFRTFSFGFAKFEVLENAFSNPICSVVPAEVEEDEDNDFESIVLELMSLSKLESVLGDVLVTFLVSISPSREAVVRVLATEGGIGALPTLFCDIFMLEAVTLRL